MILFSWGVTTRVALAAVVGRLVVREPHLWRNGMLYPFRDLLGFFFWSASYLGNEVLWRGEVYELLRGGPMATAPKLVARVLCPPAPSHLSLLS